MSEWIDNRAARIREMERLVRDLHEGSAVDDVRRRLEEVVRQCDAGEVAAMEQELLADGVPVHELMHMCDLHSEVVDGLLVERPHSEIVRGHPVDVFRRENEALAERARRIREGLRALVDSAGETGVVDDTLRLAVRSDFNELMDVAKHYQRKENLLFPILERYGITGPSTVMWGKDDEVRERMGGLGECLTASGATAGEWRLVVETVAEPALAALEEMIRKEERILLPLALQTLNENEWGEIWHQSPEIGWCLIDPDGEYRPPSPQGPDIPDDVQVRAERDGIAIHSGGAAPRSPTSTPGADYGAGHAAGPIVFPTGSLDLEQLKAIFTVLPVDLTFVDADDRVRFFSEGASRVFVRPKAIIGRKVEHCHPPSSVHVVKEILSTFRTGEKSVAEFWIEHHDHFVHIRYFAVRSEQGVYVGTLEVTQDLTHQRALRGERRLPAYD